MKTPDTHIKKDIVNKDIASEATLHTILHTLDAQAGQYDIATQMRLNEARARAVAAIRAKTPFWRSTPLLAAAFAMSAAFIVVVLTLPHSVPASELEASALYEATFGAGVADEAPSAAVFWDVGVGETALAATALDATVVDEAVVANDLEFYAWLSETSAQRATPANAAGSDS